MPYINSKDKEWINLKYSNKLDEPVNVKYYLYGKISYSKKKY